MDAYETAQDAAIRLNAEERERFAAWFTEWHRQVTSFLPSPPLSGPPGPHKYPHPEKPYEVA